MFVEKNDLWIADEWLSPLTKWRLKRRLEKYSDRHVLPLLAVPTCAIFFLMLTYSTSLVAAIMAAALTGVLTVVIFIVGGPDRRRGLVEKLHRQGRVFPSSCAAVRVLEPLMRAAGDSPNAYGDVSRLAVVVHRLEADYHEEWCLPIDDRRRESLDMLATRLLASPVNYAVSALHMDGEKLHTALDERIDAEQAGALDVLRERMDRYERLAGESMGAWVKAMTEVSISRQQRDYGAHLAAEQ